MAKEEIVNEFDALFAEIIATTPEVAVAEVADPGEPGVVAPPVLKMEAVAVQEVVAKPAPKPDRYREVDGKVQVDGGPCATTVYPRGYVQFKQGPDWNKFAMYEEDILAWRDFFADAEQFEEWFKACKESGLKRRTKG